MPNCPRFAGRRSSRLRSPFLLGLIALCACNVPNFEGPQIQEPPQGFLLVPDSYQQRRIFPQHELVFHSAWVESTDDFSTIYVDGYPGVLGLEDAMAARDSAWLYAIDPDVTFTEVEPLLVDGRAGWGWAERVETPTRGLVWVAYRAIVPYDTVTYAIEFYSGEPAIKRSAPDTLKAVIASFGIGRTTYNLPLIAVLAGLALFVVSFVRSKAKARSARLQAIHLVKIPKKKKDEAGTPASGAPPVDPPEPLVRRAGSSAQPPATSWPPS